MRVNILNKINLRKMEIPRKKVIFYRFELTKSTTTRKFNATAINTVLQYSYNTCTKMCTSVYCQSVLEC